MQARHVFRAGLPALALLTSVAGLSGCGTMGASEYSCDGYPKGQTCMSVREVYEGDDRVAEEHTEAVEQAQAARDKAWSGQVPAEVPRPIRTPAQVMRIWHAPMEDSRGVLNMATYSFVEVETRRWSVGEAYQEGSEGRRMMRMSPGKAPQTTDPASVSGARGNDSGGSESRQGSSSLAEEVRGQ